MNDGTFPTTPRPAERPNRLHTPDQPADERAAVPEVTMVDDGGPFPCDGCDKHIGSRQIRHIEHHNGRRYIYCPDCAADARAGRIGPEAPEPDVAETTDSADDDSMPSGEVL